MLELLSVLVIALYLRKFKLILGLLTITKWLRKKLISTKQSIDLIKISVAHKPKIYKLRLLGNTESNLQFFSKYFYNTEMFINKNAKYWKNPIPVFTELPCDGGDNDEGEGDEVDGNNKDAGLDNVNAGDGENKVDLGNVYNGGDSVDVGRVNTNCGDDADFGNGDRKFNCDADRGGGDGDDKDDGGVDDDDADSDMVMMLTVVIEGAKFIAVKIWLLMTVMVNLMVVVILIMMVRVVMIVMVKVMIVLVDIKIQKNCFWEEVQLA